MPKSKKTKQTNTNNKSARKNNPMKKQQAKTSTKKTTKKTAQKKSPQSNTKSAVKNSPKKTMKKTNSNSSKTTVTEKIKNTESIKSVLNKQTIAILVVVALIGLAYIFRGVFVAAMVNGQPISRLKIVREAEEMQGGQILENYVMEALIEQKAREKGIQISDEVVDAQIEEIKQSVADQGQDFDQLLSLQGLTMEELERQIRMQQMIEVMVGADIEVSDEQVAEYLENNKDFLPEDMEQDELEELAKQQLQQQEMSQKYQEWMDNLKQEANLKYFVGYGEDEVLTQ
jgi:hypothetical protein